MLQYTGTRTTCCVDDLSGGYEPNIASKGEILNTGGSETRPVNINVMYIICAKNEPINFDNYTHQNDFLSLRQEVNTISNTQQENIGNLNQTYITLPQILLGLNATHRHDFSTLQKEAYAIKNSQQSSSKDNNSFLMGFVGGLVGGIHILVILHDLHLLDIWV